MDASYVLTEYNSRRIGFLYEDGQLCSTFYIDKTDKIGNVYVGRVINIIPSINAAFIDVGLGDYFYYSLKDNENTHLFTSNVSRTKLATGDEILVQVSKEAMKTKKGEVTGDISFTGKYLIINRSGAIGVSHSISDNDTKDRLKTVVGEMIRDYDYGDIKEIINLGAIIRTSAADADIEKLREEFISLTDKLCDLVRRSRYMKACSVVLESGFEYMDIIRNRLVKGFYNNIKIITDKRDLYNDLTAELSDDEVDISYYDDEMVALDKVYNIETDLKKLFSRTVYLKSGGSLIVEPTEAMTVIDVNSGKAIKGKNAEASYLKINMEAASQIARLLRVRNMSGIIIIDFISMKDPESVKKLTEHMKSELKKDEVKALYVDMTPLGLVEITRKKITKPLTLDDFN